MRFTTSQSPRVFGAVGMRLRLYFGREIELQIARICRCEIPSSAPGPRSCERGEAREPERLHQVDLASMGPRSCERGESPTNAELQTATNWLQRGRARVSAESELPALVEYVGWRRFNGAALV